MRTLLLVACIALPSFAVVFEETSIEVGDALRSLGEFGRVNVVLLHPMRTRIEVAVSGKPWAQAFDEIVVKEGLARVREGNVIVVGAPDVIEKRRSVKYAMKRVRVLAVGARATDVAESVARACKCKPGKASGDSFVTLSLRDVPADQVVALAREVGVAAGHEVNELKVTAVVVGTATPSAVLVDASGAASIVGLKDRVGTEGATVTRITTDEVSLSTGVDLLVGGGSLPSNRSRTRPLQIDEVIALIDSFGAETFRDRRKAIERKRALLVFMRDALKMEFVEEALDNTADEQLWKVPATLPQQVDDAIVRGATATPEVVSTAPHIPLLHHAALYDAWVARESKDDRAFNVAVDAALSRFEADVKFGPAPPELTWLLENTTTGRRKRVAALIKRYG